MIRLVLATEHTRGEVSGGCPSGAPERCAGTVPCGDFPRTLADDFLGPPDVDAVRVLPRCTRHLRFPFRATLPFPVRQGQFYTVQYYGTGPFGTIFYDLWHYALPIIWA